MTEDSPLQQRRAPGKEARTDHGLAIVMQSQIVGSAEAFMPSDVCLQSVFCILAR